MNFRFRHLRYFLAVAEHLHFRRAAEHLGMAQPALSRAIRDLEMDLGVTLFTRNNRRVELTEAGKVFQHDCRRLLNGAEQAIENVRQVHHGNSGSLRIGYTDMAIAGCLPDLLTNFQAEYSNIVIKPHLDPTIYQMERLMRDELEIGFVTGPVNIVGFSSHPVQFEKFICLVPDTHRLADENSVDLKNLANEDFIFGTAKEWQNFYSYIFPMCRQAGFTPHTVQEAYDTTAIVGLVACGVGITLQTEGVTNYLHKGVKAIPLLNSTEKLVTEAVWKTNNPSAPLAKFVDFLRTK